MMTPRSNELRGAGGIRHVTRKGLPVTRNQISQLPAKYNSRSPSDPTKVKPPKIIGFKHISVPLRRVLARTVSLHRAGRDE
jgi:hypothetical protein